MTVTPVLVLVDGSALAFRSFYALYTAGMRKSDGTPTWAVFGFVKALFDLIEKQKPDLMAVCFDLAEPTFRHLEFEEYKANRAEMPDELSRQWPVIKDAVDALNIPIYELAGYEADDIIGTVAKQAASKGMQVLILTGDQDAFQLLGPNIQVLMPGKEGLMTYGRQEVFAKLGVWPEQVPDYKGICGDTSDNIPGVKGIGPKTAVPLLQQYESLEGIYEHLDELKGAAKQKLIDGRKIAFASKDLATIRLDVPLAFDFEHCRMTMPEIKKVVSFLKDVEFNSILRRLPKVLALFNNGVPPEIDPSLLQATTGRRQQIPGQSKQADTANSVSLVQPTIVVGSGALEPMVVRTTEELERLINKLSQQSVLSVDLETTGLASLDTDVVGYAFAWSNGALLSDNNTLKIKDDNWQIETAYVPVRHWGEVQLDPELVAQALKPVLESAKIGKIAQNAKFEMNVLSLLNIQFGPMVFDPMLASYISNPDEAHGLKDQSQRLLDHTMVRITDLIGVGRKQLSMAAVPVNKVAPYAADDARIALLLSQYYVHKMDKEQQFLLWEMDLPLTAVLAKMEQTGVALDEKYLRDFSKELSGELWRLEQEIYALVGHSFNINSTQQLQKVLFEELKLPTKARTKSGFSTDAAVLESLRQTHDIVPKILEYRQIAKLRSTYVESLPRQISERDHRLHGEFNQTGTSTGRLSSSNPNLQNIPIRTELGRCIRKAFIPAGTASSLVSADYSQIELRLLAHMSQDETLIDAFNRGQDIHARTAGEIFDVPIDSVTNDMRRIGKTINFSLIYQQGAYSTGIDLGISTREAQAFIDKYFSRYPRVRAYMNATIENARKTGYVQTLWGRKRYFNRLNDRNEQVRRAEERAACNAPLQGSAADLMKLAMIELDKELTKQGFASRLILQVHDELVLEVPEAEVEEISLVVSKAMTLSQPFAVPLVVDVGVGKTWMEA